MVASLAGRNTAVCGLIADVRKRATDHIYVIDWIWQKNSAADLAKKADEEFLFFISNGLSIRGITTNRSATAQTTNSSNGIFGTLYLGMGFDGPLYESVSGGSSKGMAPAGFASIETYAANTTANAKDFSSMYSPSPPRNIANWGAAGRISLPGSFDLSIEYARPIGTYGQKFVGDLRWSAAVRGLPSDVQCAYTDNTPATTKTRIQGTLTGSPWVN